LRQFSSRVDAPATELNINQTIRATCDNAGRLKLVFEKPRKNIVKLMLLMDSGGSMDDYAVLCSSLFSAVSKSNHFKDLKVYYFHNCVYTRLYQDPTLSPRDTVPTQWVVSNLPGDWKVIFVGDAQMAPYELSGGYYGRKEASDAPTSGLDWLKLLREQYRNCIWLNPSERPDWGDYWSQTYDAIARLIPMFPLTVEGLEEGMKKLLTR
jgi:uncharacterized protein with von Willebrand factor type A (vWA) domain